MIRLIVLIKDELYSDGVKFHFEGNPDMCVAGEAAGSNDFLQLLGNTPADVALLGVNNPDDHSRVDLASHIRRTYPALKILAVANEGTAKIVQSMKKAGINGYIGRKQTTRRELANAIRTVAAGKQYAGKVDKSDTPISEIRHKIDSRQKLNKSEIEQVEQLVLSHIFQENKNQ